MIVEANVLGLAVFLTVVLPLTVIGPKEIAPPVAWISPKVWVVTFVLFVEKPFVKVMAEAELFPRITPPVLKKLVKGVTVPPALNATE